MNNSRIRIPRYKLRSWLRYYHRRFPHIDDPFHLNRFLHQQAREYLLFISKPVK